MVFVFIQNNVCMLYTVSTFPKWQMYKLWGASVSKCTVTKTKLTEFWVYNKWDNINYIYSESRLPAEKGGERAV